MPFFGVPIRNGLPIGLGSVAGFGVQQFDPLELFAGGAEGVWYDPSDTSTLFQDPAGTTPVTAVEQPVGLMLDKSKGLVLGSELGSISTGWTAYGATPTTVAYSNGVAITNNGTTGGASYALTTVVGRAYRITITITPGVSLNERLRVGNTVGGIELYNQLISSTRTIYVFATATTTYVSVAQTAANNGAVTTVSAFSVRELPGNHAISYNSTTARPTLSARVNLLVATATLSTQSVTTQATSYTLSFAGAGSITLSGTATGSYNAGTHTITCTAGTLTLTVSGAVTTADLRPANSGALLPAYQAVVDANTYDTNGFPKYLYFAGVDDGMSTPANLNLTSTDKVAVFSGVRKLSDAVLGMLVELSSVANNNDGAFAIAAPGWSPATSQYGSLLRATVNNEFANSPASFSAPITNVLTNQFFTTGSTQADRTSLRVNGAAQTLTFTGNTTASGNFGTYPLYIGSRNNASAWLNGYLYGLTVVGAQLTTPQIESMESWTAQRTGITL